MMIDLLKNHMRGKRLLQSLLVKRWSLCACIIIMQDLPRSIDVTRDVCQELTLPLKRMADRKAEQKNTLEIDFGIFSRIFFF